MGNTATPADKAHRQQQDYLIRGTQVANGTRPPNPGSSYQKKKHPRGRKLRQRAKRRAAHA